MYQFRHLRRYVLGAIVLATCSVNVGTAAQAGEIFNLDATNISYFIPSPLFTSNTVTGSITLADSVLPGGSFGVQELQALSFDVGGHQYTLADFLPGYDVDGRISSDDQSITFLSSGYDLNTALPGCGGGCFGSLDIAQSQPSNLFVISDPSFSQYGGIQFYTAFTRAVPEPLTLSLFGAGLAGASATRRRRKSNTA